MAVYTEGAEQKWVQYKEGKVAGRSMVKRRYRMAVKRQLCTVAWQVYMAWARWHVLCRETKWLSVGALRTMAKTALMNAATER